MKYSRFAIMLLRLALAVALPLMAPDLANALDPPVNAVELGHWDGYTGVYADVWADGDYAYVSNLAVNDGLPARVNILDISDSGNPVLDNVLTFASPNEFASPQDVKVGDGLLFVALDGDGNDGVSIVDVRDPTAPLELATIRIVGFEDSHNLFYDQGFLYIVDSSDPEMAIVDLTNFNPDNPPASPLTQAKWIVHNIGGFFVHDVTVKNGRAYLCAWNDGLWIYDVSDVANTAPVFLGMGPGTATHAVWPTDDGEFAVVSEERPDGPIKLYQIVTIDSFVSLHLLDTVALPDDAYSAHNPFVVGDRVYVSWYQAGLQVFDIDRDAGELVLVASFDTSELRNNGLFHGNFGVYPQLGTQKILLSDMDGGLTVVAVLPEDCTQGNDCNDNGLHDQCDVIVGTSQDCNGTLIPDECEIASGSSLDCQKDGVPDECEGDCNNNGVADECDVNAGTSTDCQGNLIPDECESDCNDNAVPDSCDIGSGTSEDCTADGIPDECEPDCNGNAVADSCDIATGTSVDCNGDEMPDECEPDCNGNGVADECDITSGASLDCDTNAIPDECEPDCNRNGIPDTCDLLPRLSGLLTNLERNHAAIGELIPDRFDFSEGETGTCIIDGGNDMYDCGNILSTSRASLIEYTDNGVVSSEDEFGPGSEHFTAKYPGLFVLAASQCTIDDFEITGNNGADGAGDVDGVVLSTTSSGEAFTIFVKRVFGAEDPSINHIIIVPGDSPGVTHNFSGNTNDDRHQVVGLGEVTSLYYLLVARQGGLFLEDTDVLNIADEFLTSLAVGSSLDCNANQVPDECDIADGASHDRNANGIPDECEKPSCEGDANGDGEVDPLDSGFVLARFGCLVGADDSGCDTADQNGDGLVNPLDLGFVLARFGGCT